VRALAARRLEVRHDEDVLGSRAFSPMLLRARRPSSVTGGLVAVGGLVAATLAIYPLSQLAPVVSLSVVYLPAVVVASAFWGLRLGLTTAVASAAAFNFFHLPPVGRFTIADSRNWVALGAFTVVAIATGLIGDLARARAEEADERRREADLAAELAQLLLGGAQVDDALALAAQRLAVAIGVGAAAIELHEVHPNERQLAFCLGEPDHRLGTLVLPASITPAQRAWVAERVVPPLESILGAALHRAQLQAEVVETAALRRSDELKTAVLRSVSHDLRTPVTAILTAIAALDPEHPSAENVGEVREVVTYAGTRLARLIEKLLDLTALESGTLAPRRDWYSIEEVLSEAIEGVEAPREAFQLSLEPGIRLLQGDPGQLERAFGNLLENAARYSNGEPVSVRVRHIEERIRVRIVDRGPGISRREQERIFMPFYRSPGADPAHQGSGLGLAIAKGFIEAGGGSISVESLPGQGTSFVVDLPIGPAAPSLAVSDGVEAGSTESGAAPGVAARDGVEDGSTEPAAAPSQPVPSSSS
jgi:two-component system, OmpR family, sensor histidine kinase KdpD